MYPIWFPCTFLASSNPIYHHTTPHQPPFRSLNILGSFLSPYPCAHRFFVLKYSSLHSLNIFQYDFVLQFKFHFHRKAFLSTLLNQESLNPHFSLSEHTFCFFNSTCVNFYKFIFSFSSVFLFCSLPRLFISTIELAVCCLIFHYILNT